MRVTKSNVKRHAVDLVSAVYVVYTIILFAQLFIGVGDGTLRIWEALLFLPVLIVGAWFFLIHQEYQRNFFVDPWRYSVQKRRSKNARLRTEVLTGVTPKRRRTRPGD